MGSEYYYWSRGRACCQASSLDGPLRRAMGALGYTVASHPAPFLALPLLLTAGLAYPFYAGYAAYRSHHPASDLDLFTPSGAQSLAARRDMAARFGDGGYFTDRTFSSPNLLLAIVSAKSSFLPFVPTVLTGPLGCLEGRAVRVPAADRVGVPAAAVAAGGAGERGAARGPARQPHGPLHLRPPLRPRDLRPPLPPRPLPRHLELHRLQVGPLKVIRKGGGMRRVSPVRSWGRS